MPASLSHFNYTDTGQPCLFRCSHACILSFLFIALFCVNLLIPRDLWVQDEARYGEVVREMLASGDWLVPHLNGYPYPDKPAVYFWIVIVFVKLLGQTEFAFRLVSVLSTLGAITGVYQLGRKLAGAQVGFWTTVIFATTWLALIGAHMVRMDMLVVVAAVYAWLALCHYQTDVKPIPLVIFWALSLFALAVKGPITLLFTVAPGIAWFTLEKGWVGLKSLYPLSGLLALAGAVGMWIIAVTAAGHGDYLYSIWHKQLVGRAVDAWSHKEPFYFYLLVLPLVLMPWTGLVIQGGRRLLREQPSFWRAVVIFTVVPFMGLSLVSGKLFIYLLPLFPGFCIAAALVAVRLSEQPSVSAWLAWPPVLFLAMVASLIGWISWTYLDNSRPLGVAVSVGLLTLAGIGVYLKGCSGQHWLWGWIGLSMATAWLVFGAFAYLINPLFSARGLGVSVQRHAPPSALVGAVNTTRGILNYYAERSLVEVSREEAANWVAAHKDAVLVIKTPDIKRVFGQAGIPTTCRIHETYFIELKHYHVVAGC